MAGLDPLLDGALPCYCTMLTFAELRAAAAAGVWPPAGKERTGKLCTGCEGDVLHCLRLLGARAPA
jgi:hypothetical protein